MIFVADAHLNHNRELFLDFLKALNLDEIKTEKIFFMGDMFDLLAYEISSSMEFYKEAIELINSISQTKDIFYFEGNHDFNLKDIFPKVKIFSIKQQPYLYEDMLLSHGDSCEGVSYRVFHNIVRSSLFLKLIDTLDRCLNNNLFKRYILKESKRDIYKKIVNFDKKIKQKVSLYDIDLSRVNFIIEGHYHQGESVECIDLKYINLKSFACGGVYYQYDQDRGTFQSKVFSKKIS
jgi:UDP-2,3-diacylglucosamine hydrolase